MKKICFVFLLILFKVICFAQITTNSQWTWMKGDNNYPGIYGTQGIASNANKPGGRTNSVSWTDQSGNLWLFGGYGFATNNFTTIYLNDLWKYNISNNTWTWMKGDSIGNVNGVYGTNGVAASTNKPGGRTGSISWIDQSGNLWLFGGEYLSGNFINQLNDLWKYNPLTNEWTWVSGNNLPNYTGYYTTQGGYGVPGARHGSVSWTDNNGNFWLFGGQGFASGNNSGFLNDLWKYTLNYGWTWVNGDNVINVYGVYQGPGTNKPGARQGGTSWRDLSGNFWLFGGEGYPVSGSSGGYFNKLYEMWKYDPIFNQWTWVTGTTYSNSGGSYGTVGVTGCCNHPGSRTGAISWTDQSGTFWLFGGSGYDASINSGDLNDLWKYSGGVWTWIKGDNTQGQPGVYGTQGISSSTNKPGSRFGGVSWIKDGKLWLFGGNGHDDLWKLSNVYEFTGNGDWNTASNWISNVVAPTVITAGTDVIINPSGQCTQTGNITTQALGKIVVLPLKTLTLNGNLTNAGSIEGAGILNLAVGTSTLNNTGSITTGLQLTSKQTILNSNLTVGSLDLTNSTIELGNFNLDMGANPITKDNSSFIITNGTGTLNRIVGSSAVTFPIGINGASNTPVIISNAGAADKFYVRVNPGILTRAGITPITAGAVNRTWLINKDITAGNNYGLTMQWNEGDQQVGFNRNLCFIAKVCPPPPNCAGGYDISPSAPASGANPYSINRNSFLDLNSSDSFIVRTSPVVYTFTGNGSWTNSTNWANGLGPSNIITNTMEVIIDPPSGMCTYTGNIIIQQGGKLTIQSNKVLNVIGSITVQPGGILWVEPGTFSNIKVQ